MVAFLIGLWHLISVNLIRNAILHGALTLTILNGFLLSLFQFLIAHSSSAIIYSTLIYFLKTIGIPLVVSEKEFNGIIDHLIKTSDTQIYNIINITSSSYFNDDIKYSPFNIIQYDCSNKIFMSKDEPNSWICFDFNQYRIYPSQYTIKSIEDEDKFSFPTSWVIEGSNNNKDWAIIDEKYNCHKICNHGLIRTINVDVKQKNVHFRYIRMRLTDKNVEENYIFALDSFEFYGSLAKLKNDDDDDDESIETPTMFIHK